MFKRNVFFRKLESQSSEKDRSQAMADLLASQEECNIFQKPEKVAVKIHVGEKNNDTHVGPDTVRKAVQWIRDMGARPFLTETATLYKGCRYDGISHLEHAFNHGFTQGKTMAPFIMADGLLGNTEIEVAIPGELQKSVHIAREAVLADGLVVISHATGHMQAGIGACIKNIGMGLASRIGKLRQHSSIKPFVKPEVCTLCRACIRWCPETAIVEQDGKAFIIEEKCTGCGECLAVCNYGAVAYNWGVGSEELQKQMAEHALGAVIGKKNKCVYINVLASMTKDCDCLHVKQTPVIDDIGILLSADPVAIDQATFDLTAEKSGSHLGKKGYPELDPFIQLDHAQKIGLGSREYNLIMINHS
ncbi:MAG: DUF362 domain-containing protein [Spirochaetales bacterium]|nr:DUF362 domain-containing protein [Spirochaetales bacterium]